MTLIQAIILGLVQGITEFLPISSSGHLVILEEFFGLEVKSLQNFDIVVHFGTLVAILIYFRADFMTLFKSLFSKTGHNAPQQKYIFFLFIGTLPAVLVGFLLLDLLKTYFRNSLVVFLLMAGVGILYLINEKLRIQKNYEINSVKKALLIGCAQAIAILPGVSRSGMTLSMGILLGIRREEAARFSFLLGAIAIFGAGILSYLENSRNFWATISFLPFSLGFLVSLISGYFSIGVLMNYIKKHALNVFAIYLIIVGIIGALIKIIT